MVRFACILCDPMRYPKPESAIETLKDLVALYDEPADKRDPETGFLILADAFRLLHPEGGSSMQSTFETIRGEIDSIIEKLKPIMEAAIGPAIGGEVQIALREIDAKIDACNNRIRLTEELSDPSQLYDALVATGWRTNMSREKWAADDMEHMMVAHAEKWVIGQLEYKRHKIESLFERFVTKEGRLGA